MNELFSYSIQPNIREPLAALAAEFHTLAGWQALALGHPRQACTFYETAKAAQEHSHPACHAHALAEQTNTLVERVLRQGQPHAHVAAKMGCPANALAAG